MFSVEIKLALKVQMLACLSNDLGQLDAEGIWSLVAFAPNAQFIFKGLSQGLQVACLSKENFEIRTGTFIHYASSCKHKFAR